MKILVITGSPHRRGTSMLLADEFSAGAEAAGHKVIRFDAASSRIEPCRACDYCRSHDTECIQKDDMVYLRDDLLEADAIAFVTPLYYFGMSAQLKRVIDRFYALNDALRTPKRALLLATCGDMGSRCAASPLRSPLPLPALAGLRPYNRHRRLYAQRHRNERLPRPGPPPRRIAGLKTGGIATADICGCSSDAIRPLPGRYGFRQPSCDGKKETHASSFPPVFCLLLRYRMKVQCRTLFIQAEFTDGTEK